MQLVRGLEKGKTVNRRRIGKFSLLTDWQGVILSKRQLHELLNILAH